MPTNVFYLASYLYSGKLISTEVLLCGLYYTASAWPVAGGGAGAWFILSRTYKPLLFLIINPILNLILIDIVNNFFDV